jgi:hypothetical protein
VTNIEARLGYGASADWGQSQGSNQRIFTQGTRASTGTTNRLEALDGCGVDVGLCCTWDLVVAIVVAI